MERSHTSRSASVALILILAVGAVFRLYDVDRRLMHGDEANQAIKTAGLLETGEYRYDPQEHHGPTLYYFSYALETVLGHGTRAEITETTLRIVPALFGTATIGLVWLLRHALGTPATLFAAILLALSPALAFYSRYYIHESLLAFFALSALVAVWRYINDRRVVWAVTAGAALALMFTTKETWILHAVALVVAIVAVRPWSLSSESKPNYALHAATALVVAIVIWLTFFSSFFTNWQGLVNSVTAYAAYFDRGNTPGQHQHPWHFYLARLAWHHAGPGPRWTEAFILIAAFTGAVAALVGLPSKRTREEAVHNRVGLFLTIFTLVVLTEFSIIRYKTPWNLIQFHVPLCIVGGIGLGVVWTVLKTRTSRAAFLTIVLIASAHLGWLNYAANFEYPEYPYNPYVYGHTSSAFQRLIDRIETVADDHPDADRMLIAVIQPDGDYWPLPWYLRNFKRVGYWTDVPDSLPKADILIVNSTVSEAVHEQLQSDYTFETHALRPRILRTMYVKRNFHE